MTAIDNFESPTGGKAADRSVVAAPIASPVQDDLPIPSNINTVFLGGLFILATLAACYVAAEIVLPIRPRLCAQPRADAGMRVLEREHLPRGVAAILVILVQFGTLGGLGTALCVPAASWAQKLPSAIPKLEERLSFLSRPIATFQQFIDQAQGLTQGSGLKAVPVAVQGSGLSNQLLSGTRSFAERAA